MSEHHEGIYRQLRATVLLLASPAEAQVRYLKHVSDQARTTVLADDIAEDLHHWTLCAPQLVEGPLLMASALNALTALDEQLAAIGDNIDDWTPAALSASSKWEAIRLCASEILSAMDTHFPPGKSDQLPSNVYIPAAPD